MSEFLSPEDYDWLSPAVEGMDTSTEMEITVAPPDLDHAGLYYFQVCDQYHGPIK